MQNEPINRCDKNLIDCHVGASKHSVKFIEKIVRSQAKVSRPQECVKSVPICPVASFPLPLAERTDDNVRCLSAYQSRCWSPTSLGLTQVPVEHFKVCTKILVFYSPSYSASFEFCPRHLSCCSCSRPHPPLALSVCSILCLLPSRYLHDSLPLS